MLISIITVNYNNKNGLEKTMESVFNQTYQDFEYIVIDGGSIDGSKEVIEHHTDKIDYWVSEPDKGIYNAMNKGILQAKGEYLLFLNSGDWFYNNAVLHLFDEIIFNQTSKADIYYGDVNLINHKNGHVLKKEIPTNLSFFYFFYETICHQSAFISRELFELNGGYDESFKLVSDWKFFLEMYSKNYRFQYLKLLVCNYLLGGASSVQEICSREREEVLKSFHYLMIDYVELKENRVLMKKTQRFKLIRLLKKIGLLKYL